MLYHLNELKKATLSPAKLWSDTINTFASFIPDEFNPYISIVTANTEILSRSLETFPKPKFGITTVERNNIPLKILERNIIVKAFCTLKKFDRYEGEKCRDFKDPRLLIVAPLSGHFATLLRDTVKAMLPHHEVYITDWHDARHIPLKEGKFTFNTYIDYLLNFIRYLGRDCHVLAVCQPSVPLLCAVSLLAEYNEKCQPKTMTLMGGPIDTRINPGPVNTFSLEHSLDWYKRNVIDTVPPPYEGYGRRVCPGFLMLYGFLSLNTHRHNEAMKKFYENLIKGDSESTEAHRTFYNEYRAVLDMPEDYFLDSIRIAFKEHLLPKGLLVWREYPVRPNQIRKTALMTVEGELDDISCVGQTQAAHDLCSNLSEKMRQHYVQPGVGHYGIFNGRRWRQDIQPRVAEFIRAFD